VELFSPNTPPWRGAQLKSQGQLQLHLNMAWVYGRVSLCVMLSLVGRGFRDGLTPVRGALLKCLKLFVKVKLSLCFNRAPRHEGVLGSGGIVPPLLTSALDGGEWSASRFSCFTPGKEPSVPTGEEAGWASGSFISEF